MADLSLVKNNPFNFKKAFNYAANPFAFSQEASGMPINPYALGLQAATSIASGLNIGNQNQRVGVEQPTQQFDAYGKPEYNLGQYALATKSLQPQGASAGQIISGALSGGPVGVLSTLIGGGIKKSKEEEEKKRAELLLQGYRDNFNKNMSSYNQNYLGRQGYEDQLRQYNLPTSYV